MHGKEFYLGLDIGQAKDYTALCAVERVIDVSLKEGAMIAMYNVRHLETFPLGTPYGDIVEHVSILMEQPELLHDTTLIIDKTGVGSAVFEMFESAGIYPIGITITGGEKITQVSGGYNVPKAELVDALAVSFQNGRIVIADELSEGERLATQLESFQVKIKKRSGRESFEAMEEETHDDLVLALSLAVWYGNRNGVSTQGFETGLQNDEEINKSFNPLTGTIDKC